MKTYKFLALISFIFSFLSFQSCITVFSELQSARLVGKNNVEFTPAYSSVSFTDDSETEGIQNHFGLQFAYGISEKTDLRLRYEYIWTKEGDFSTGTSVIGIGPKFSLVENKIAFAAPIGRALEGSANAWEFHPTALFTIPLVEDVVDLNISPKYLIRLSQGSENLVAFNMGFAFSEDLSKWAIRPEFGLLYNPGEKGHASHFSVGFSKAFGN